MSRHTPNDFAVDYDNYYSLLKKAQGDRQQKTFAQDAGVSIAYMNKALSGKYTKPFMPSILRKIAAASEGRVSFKELLTAAGYDYKKHMKFEDAESSDDFEYWAEKLENSLREASLIEGIVTSSLGRKGYKWSGLSLTSQEKRFLLCVSLYDLPFSKWYFYFLVRRHFLASTMEKPEVLSDKKWTERILQLVSGSQTLPGEKISIVTTDKSVFETISKLSFSLLGVFLSVILVDFETFSVIDEKYIETMMKPDENTPSLI